MNKENLLIQLDHLQNQQKILEQMLAELACGHLPDTTEHINRIWSLTVGTIAFTEDIKAKVGD